ncbi:Cubilin like, partial [Pseudolycoriella hygida]
MAELKERDRAFEEQLLRMKNTTINGPVNLTNIYEFRTMQRKVQLLRIRYERLLFKLKEDNCRSNPCLNGGTCVDMYEDFNCQCPPNWEGKICSSDVDECAMFAGTELGCQNGASCSNTPGSYRCSCPPGWQGLHCTKQNVGCAIAGADLCGHGTCISTSEPMGFKCICDQGWQTNGVSLDCSVDIDECSLMSPYCSKDPPVQCINLPGSFACGNCPAGFTGNGHYCVDVNECDVNNGGCSTAPFVECINTKGSSRCGYCPAGWQGDGRFCMRSTLLGDGTTGACARQNICHPLATCTETTNGPLCYCPPGYVGSGFGPMGCLPGTALQHPCSTNPCQNGGTCASNGTSFTCSCPVGTNPPVCAYAFNPCNSNPCQNGGTCIKLVGFNYQCSCSPSFTGLLCENERSECGGVLNSLSGTIKYPLSDTFPHEAACAWQIQTDESKVLNVTFTKFDLQMSTECRFNWLQIYDGRSSSSRMIGRFCGSSLPKGGNFVSTTNMLYLWFRFDNSSARDGFELEWESVDAVCGGRFEVDSHGTISSPGAPGNYPPNRDCDWIILAPFGKRIQFQFFTMQLEEHENCAYDFVAIYNENGLLLQDFCNTSHPKPFTTPGNYAVVKFHSDETGSDAGFQIHYTVVEGIPGCGGVFTASEGEFGPPIQNGAYQRNTLCEYLIRMPVDYRIQIKFNSFQLKESIECEYDNYIEIFEGTTRKDPKVNRYCGNTVPPPYTSLGNTLLIVFKTRSSAYFEGFRVKYEIVCSELFENDTGVIESAFYPARFERSSSCYYEILAPPGKAISLHFEDFDVQNRLRGCISDFVKIFDGFDVSSTEIGEYCISSPPDVISSSNVLLILLRSSKSYNGRGFKASYSFVDVKCGGVIKKLGHAIQPPKKSATEYEHNAECVWIIVAPEGFLVQLTFFDFSLEHSTECSLDSVTLYEGTPSNGTKIDSYCGTNPPPVIQSASNVLSVKFVSDSSVTAEGFRAQYVFVDSKTVCGGTYNAVSGNLRSTGWPNKYPPNKKCIWILLAPTGIQIELLINDFELEHSKNCLSDYLEL